MSLICPLLSQSYAEAIRTFKQALLVRSRLVVGSVVLNEQTWAEEVDGLGG